MTITHMAGGQSPGTGSGGSFYDPPNLDYPDYDEDDFTCCTATGQGNCVNGSVCDSSTCGVGDFNDPSQVHVIGSMLTC